MDWLFLALSFVGVLALTLGATYGVLRLLRRRAVLDHPTPRSSHTVPTPRGGGLAVVAVVVPVWAAAGLDAGAPLPEVLALAGGAVALAVVSWFDDLAGLTPPWRLLAQAAAVAVVLAAMPAHGPFFGGLLPPGVDLLAAGLLWVWFINLFNFMDGIDGIAGAETAAIGVGVALVAAAGGLDGTLALYGLSAAAAALGFLWWNWQPARIFLGDVGSVPLGFLLGWLLLALSAHGHWAPALILPLYYLADATVTLGRRALRGEPLWRAHRQHFYQLAVQRGLGHGAVVLRVVAADVVLIVLAVVAVGGRAWPAVAGAVVVVAGLLVLLAGGRRR